jgi:hypothetical protein
MYQTYGSDMAKSRMHDRMREAEHYRLTKETRQAHAGERQLGPEGDEGRTVHGGLADQALNTTDLSASGPVITGRRGEHLPPSHSRADSLALRFGSRRIGLDYRSKDRSGGRLTPFPKPVVTFFSLCVA